MTKADNWISLHGHGPDSLLDGGSKIAELVKRAKEVGMTAIGLTDHGVCAGIPELFDECKKAGIKPIPGCEMYMTENRQLKGEEFSRMRDYIMKKFMIVDKKKKPTKKPFQQFIRKVRKNFDLFEEEATSLLKNYLMASPNNTLDEFKKDIFEYLDYSENFHLVMIAVNNQGLEDLYEINSDSHINGFHSDPRTDLKYIRDNDLGKHIIATSACLGSYFAKLIFADRYDDARTFIEECKETFHSFYLEKQATDVPDQKILNDIIDKLATETNTPKIVTTDVHFARKEDHPTHDILVAANFGKCITDTDRYVYSQDHYIKSIDEIRETFHDEEAILNTLKIAEMVNVEMPSKPLFPEFTVEDGEPLDIKLKKMSWNALFQFALRHPEIDYNLYANRLDYELSVIVNEGFTDYFLICEDFVNATKKAGFLLGPGRGSGAGSLVCYMLNITTLDPIKEKLLFERFLNPERAGYPDLDIDFSYEAARWCFQYLKKKYGHDRVAQIGTKGTLAAKAVCRLVGKALGYSLQIEDQFAKAIPDKPGTKLLQAYEESSLVKKYAGEYPEWWEAMLSLEGHQRQVGTHAAGVVISPCKITKRVPLRLDKDELETTQFDMEIVERLLVKFDLLKLDTLDLLKITMQNAGIWGTFNIEDINLNDPKIYAEVYNKLNLSGIFQVEGDGMKDVITHMKPNCFEDIGVICALYRPGPMDLIPTYINRKFGREPVVYPFPELKEVLEDTFGVWTYQEQIMSASQILGGLTLGQADMIRKGVAKKKADLMNRWIDLMIYGSEHYKAKHTELITLYPDKKSIPLDEKGDPSIWVDYDYEREAPYVEGALARGFDLKKLLELKKQWIKFGEYCFNRAHSAAYAKISVQTAYFKCYYPAEFMAALMTISEGKKDKYKNPKNVVYMRECEAMGMDILPPDFNQSNDSWTPVIHNGRSAIRYGLASIAGVTSASTATVQAIRPVSSFVEALERNETIRNVVDTTRVLLAYKPGTTEPLKALNKTQVSALIKAGAFDTMDSNRNRLLREYYSYRGDDYSEFPSRTTKQEIIKYERELLGTSVTIKSRWETVEEGKQGVQFTGHLIKIDPFTSKKGAEHCRVTLETAEDEIQCLIFNRTWLPLKGQLSVGVKVTAKGNKSDGSLLINTVKPA